ncbi:MAG: ABC transporter permease [Armatimonadetes bacterium]|nr:ABC transporter permease [Anaerolineae bacterium]
MRYDLITALRSIRARPVQTLIPVLVMALSIALSISVLALGDGVQQGIIRASDPFGVLVIGPKGDGQQLVLNSILLQGLPLGTIPYEIYTTLAADERVRLAVPLAFGDNLGGAPLIGTDATFFELRSNLNAPPAFQVVEGRIFTAEFEAVLGSRAAATLGLTLGDQFRGAHGFSLGLEDDVHEQVYTVVGVLGESGSPYDSAVYTTVASIWEAHAEEDPNPLIIGDAGGSERLTSILVQPVGFVDANQLWQAFYTGTTAQAAFPGQELGGLFDLLRQGERVLTGIGYLVLAIAALTVFLSVYSATLNRQHDIAVMRSLGAGRTNVFRMVLFETLLLCISGALLGRVLGYSVAAGLAAYFAGQSAIPIPVRYLVNLEPLLWLLPVGVGLLAGVLPAALAYSVDVVDKLFAA